MLSLGTPFTLGVPMSVETDPALYSSNYERMKDDAYYTEPAVSGALVRRIPSGITNIWEPSAGRGDMARVFADNGYNVFCSDINAEQFDDAIGPFEQVDFLASVPSFYVEERIDAICGNPPFGTLAEQFVRKALSMDDIRFVAFVLRAEWNHAKGVRDLFADPQYHFAKEIVLTWRPRWDWWLPKDQQMKLDPKTGKKVKMSPRHNFSIFCWDREHKGPSTQDFATRQH